MLSGTDALEKDKIINHQLKAKCESQRTSLAACKEAVIPDLLVEQGVKNQAQHLITRAAKLKRKLNSQTWYVCFSKVRTLTGKRT